MSKYVVEGGIFTSTEFRDIEPGTEEQYGPFSNYEAAHHAWMNGTFNSKLDICCHRLLIKQID